MLVAVICRSTIDSKMQPVDNWLLFVLYSLRSPGTGVAWGRVGLFCLWTGTSYNRTYFKRRIGIRMALLDKLVLPSNGKAYPSPVECPISPNALGSSQGQFFNEQDNR